MDFNKHITNPRLTLSLAAALGQGLLLAWLHTRISLEEWPYRDPSWFAAVCSVAVVAPVAFHVLSEHWRSALLWVSLAIVSAVTFCFGWHFGARVGAPLFDQGYDNGQQFVYGISVALLWLLCLPFLRRRLVTGRWRGDYADLFTLAWQSKIALAEAAVFTGALWLLILLWMMLFKTLGYGFFERFFEWPGFVYSFTAVAFAVGLYLTGSLERIVVVVREQVLGLLKWLAPVAALILALFAPTLLVRLPGLVFSGEHAISAAWLLWLVAVFVLLLNAAFQNGQQERPYPKFLAVALRCVVPAMLIVVITALYSLWVRIGEYGITIARVYAVIVGLAALAYATGYGWAALRRGQWMQGVARVNVVVAIGLIGIIALTLTPIASPARLAASSQAGQASTATDRKTRESALRYLRFDSGRYGIEKLNALATAKGNEKTTALAEYARLALKLEHRWGAPDFLRPQVATGFAVYPQGRTLEPSLRKAILDERDLSSPEGDADAVELSILFADLDGDATDEAVVLGMHRFVVFAHRGSRWRNLGSNALPGCVNAAQLRAALQAGDYEVRTPKWRNLRLGPAVLPVGRTVPEDDDAPAVKFTASRGCNGSERAYIASDSMG